MWRHECPAVLYVCEVGGDLCLEVCLTFTMNKKAAPDTVKDLKSLCHKALVNLNYCGGYLPEPFRPCKLGSTST